jgi:hypothetical protein
MKCDICGGVAVIGMPPHRLNLCAEPFVEWVPPMVERVIRRYAMFTLRRARAGGMVRLLPPVAED